MKTPNRTYAGLRYEEKSMDREELIKTVTRITELRSEISRLSSLREELKRLEATLDEKMGTTPPAAQQKTARPESIEDTIARLIDNNPNKEWTANEVAQAAGAKVPTTRAVFSKLRKAGRIYDTARRGYVQSMMGKKQGPALLDNAGPVKVA
jgi:septal ring factor EnvC (AmiA/AmiB activator)